MTGPAQLDPVMNSETSSDTKTADKQLVRVQTLLLDSLTPLTSLLKTHHKSDTLDQKEMIQTMRSEMQLLTLPVITYYTSGEGGREGGRSNSNKDFLFIVRDDKTT